MSKKKDNTEPVIFKELVKSETRKIRVWRSEFKGRVHNSIQNIWRSSAADEWQFGKGITFHEEDIDDLIEGLQAMNEWYTENS